jgi:hypothetical protein
MIRPITCIAFLLACGSGLYLYQTKHRVKLLDDHIARVVRSTDAMREQTRMLAAEWTLLNDPERLRVLANQFLSLQTVAPNQFTSLADLDKRLPPPVLPVSPDSAVPASAAPVASAGGGDANAARVADAGRTDAKAMQSGFSAVTPALAKEITPSRGVTGTADDAAPAIDRRAAPHSAPARVAAADQPRPALHADADRRAAAEQHDADRRADPHDIEHRSDPHDIEHRADPRDVQHRTADQRPPAPRRIQPAAYEPRQPRPVVAARSLPPAAGGSFLGMAHSMSAPVPLPRPMPMNGSGTAYGGTGG